jgi:hypothetical protein
MVIQGSGDEGGSGDEPRVRPAQWRLGPRYPRQDAGISDDGEPMRADPVPRIQQ